MCGRGGGVPAKVNMCSFPLMLKSALSQGGGGVRSHPKSRCALSQGVGSEVQHALHLRPLDVGSVLMCGQKEDMGLCTCLYSHAAMHYGILPLPPVDKRKDRHCKNITLTVCAMCICKVMT